LSKVPVNTIEIVDGVLGYPDTNVLSNLNLCIKQGELIGVIGCSGAGKSTLLGALSGANVQTGGSLLVNGVDPRTSTHPVGLVPQLGHEVATNLRVSELVALGSPRYGLFTSREERINASKLLEKLGLLGLENRRIDELSGGQRQRVSIARALTSSASLLLCDEPTSGADPVLAADIINVLSEIASSGTTVVIATHDLSVVIPKLERVIGLSKGTISFDDQVSNFAPEAYREVYSNYSKKSGRN